ncbi:hypothetical protein DFH07DRAFT_1057034 [Mycena maculata]|uniref:F-box domain-containing protein n=1 Tax=Mycena maculata TaxID=230809 RepID=A0AAD7NT74_9AGAR|nr:hypothetical protein DFH07DRAFT_1057034 [Mycena maculata]
MATTANPLRIQELLDRFIGFLSDSDPDLRSCALVNRAWVHASQSHLFSTIKLYRASVSAASLPRTSSRLLEILEASPHLVRVIVTLHLDSIVGPENFFSFCGLPYMRLADLRIYGIIDLPSDREVSALRQLLGVPTIESLHNSGDFPDTSQFLKVWEGCSSTIRDLQLCVRAREPPAPDPPSDALHHRIKVESLELYYHNAFQWWFDHIQCPFDFAGVRQLSFMPFLGMVSRNLSQAFMTVEVLNLLDIGFAQGGDLSVFERVVDVKMYLSEPSWALNALRTLPPQNHIQTIRFLLMSDFPNVPEDQEPYLEFDRAFSMLSFPNLRVVHMDVPLPVSAMNGGPETHFPSLSASGILHWDFQPSRYGLRPVDAEEDG